MDKVEIGDRTLWKALLRTADPTKGGVGVGGTPRSIHRTPRKVRPQAEASLGNEAEMLRRAAKRVKQGSQAVIDMAAGLARVTLKDELEREIRLKEMADNDLKKAVHQKRIDELYAIVYGVRAHRGRLVPNSRVVADDDDEEEEGAGTA